MAMTRRMNRMNSRHIGGGRSGGRTWFFFFSSSRSGDGENKNTPLRRRSLVSRVQRSSWRLYSMLALLTFSSMLATVKYVRYASRYLDVNTNNVKLSLLPPLSPEHMQVYGQERKCKCVDCDEGEDNICGGLWRGNRYPSRSIRPSEKKIIHIVVSHCKASLNWMPSYLGDLTNNVTSIHILSKCGQDVEGAPENAEIQVLPNVGRNDHAFAYYITSILPHLPTNDSSVVVFLKDTMMERVHQGSQFCRTDLKSMVQLSSSSNGFACGISIVEKSWSVYHDKDTLFSFTKQEYSKGVEDYHTADGVPFQSETVSSVGDFYTSLDANPLPALVQVCYGGIFAASTANIFKQDAHVWKAMEKSLSRGDNIEEGHYAERLWGALIATPLQAFQIESLRRHSTRVRKKMARGQHGTLRRGERDDDY